MLFIHNPIPSERDLKVEFDDRHNECNKKCDITRFVITGVFLYVLTSLFSIILNYPVSLITIIIPSIVLVYAIVVLSGDRRRDLWPCIFAAFAGFILKVLAIVLFFIIYPLRDNEIAPKIVLARKRSGIFGWTKLEEKAVFFGILFVAEFVLLILTCCLHWHLVAFCDRPQANTTIGGTRRNSRSPRRGHPV